MDSECVGQGTAVIGDRYIASCMPQIPLKILKNLDLEKQEEKFRLRKHDKLNTRFPSDFWALPHPRKI